MTRRLCTLARVLTTMTWRLHTLARVLTTMTRRLCTLARVLTTMTRRLCTLARVLTTLTWRADALRAFPETASWRLSRYGWLCHFRYAEIRLWAGHRRRNKRLARWRLFLFAGILEDSQSGQDLADRGTGRIATSDRHCAGDRREQHRRRQHCRSCPVQPPGPNQNLEAEEAPRSFLDCGQQSRAACPDLRA